MAKGIKGKLRRVNFGVDVKRFAPSGSNHRDIDIISLRNHDPIYDIDTLLRAVKLLEPEFPNLQVFIGGKGPETLHLVDLAAQLGLLSAHFRTFEPGEVERRLDASKVYVSTALSDAGIAASTAEAMACGLPVVISDVFENRNWVCPGRQLKGLCFQIYRPGDATELAEKISFMLNRPDTRKTLGQMNRKTVVQWNNYDTEMEKMEKLYQKLLITKGDRLRL
jgi:glycosyltransferase involved in cell wall biosynthesis